MYFSPGRKPSGAPHRASLFAALFVLACPAVHAAPTQCDSIASVPITWNIDYATDIQGLFNERCSNCHVDHAGSPDANLDLDPKWSYDNLVGSPSSSPTGGTLVIPGDPGNSVLFQKINCGVPDSGVRMPRARPVLPLADQALIYDWIMLGAPRLPTDFIFASGFELRP